MDKVALLKAVILNLEESLSSIVTLANEAKAEATNEESKAENKYDTRGLEASYLAGGQAKRADEFKQTIDRLQKIEIQNFKEGDLIGMTTLIHIIDQDENEKWLFILPFAGGTKIQFKNHEILVITPQSPMGQKLMGLKADSDFSVTINGKAFEYDILEVY